MKTPDANAMLMKLAKAQAFVWGHRDGMEGRVDRDLLDRADDGDPVGQAYLKGYELGEKHRRAE